MTRSSKNIFVYVYNSLGAEARFALYYNTIDNRADFFGASVRYEQNVGSGAKWYGGAEDVSRRFLTGLGADGSGSSYTFLMGSLLAGVNAPSIYEWRAEAGNSLMDAGFSNFSNLYNKTINNVVSWDINQLMSEQKILQPIHEKYLTERIIFRTASRISGVDILDYASHVLFGCKLLGYNEAQGCKP